MSDIQALVDALSDATRDTRSNYHLTLGRAIKWLTGVDNDLLVKLDWNNLSPDEPSSYRGYYSDLAFDWIGELVTVADFRRACAGALGGTFEGYKGGDFLMDEDTPLWSAQYGNTGRAIIGITRKQGAIVLLTKDLADD